MFTTTDVQPMRHRRSTRRWGDRVLTSGDAGKVIPVGYVPLLREDAVKTGSIHLRVQMAETALPLMNAVRVRLRAVLVPFLAINFDGLDEFNDSYASDNFIPLGNYGGGGAFHQTLGFHAVDGEQHNTFVVRAYNEYVNWERLQVSREFTLRNSASSSLARSLWNHTALRNMVPSYDAARIDGQVSLTVADASMPVDGIGFRNTLSGGGGGDYVEADGETVTYTDAKIPDHTNDNRVVAFRQDAAGLPEIFAQLKADGISVSLANIRSAQVAVRFAEVRAKYRKLFPEGDDDDMIDLLMEGISLPEENLKRPQLLGETSKVLGLNTRYSTSSGALSEQVTQGFASMSLRFATPPIGTGGVILFVADIVPEQLFERMEDPFIAALSVSDLPNAVRDALDPQQVDVVLNKHIDIAHTVPNGVFAYEPMNAKWHRQGVRLGGKFRKRVPGGAFDEDRGRIWTAEPVDPSFSEDFLLVTELPNDVFEYESADTFELLAHFDTAITGNTVFGARLEEGSDEYEQVLEQAETEE
jgi:hypothetical protein